MTAWIAALPAVLAALALLLVPGLLATAPLRLGLVARAALAAVTSVACLGVAGVVFGLLGMPFGPWQPLVPAFLLGLLAWAFRRRLRPARIARAGVRWWWPVLSWAGAAILIACVAFWSLPSPDRISQTYDNVFHLSAIAHILQTGDASSLTLRTLIETDRTWSFYPAGWHALVAATVQLTGVTVPVAVNAAWIAVSAAVWLPGVAWLAQVILRRSEPGRVALVALPLGAAFAAMPYALLTWGTLYPTFLGTALLPAAVAVPLAAWRRAGDASGTRIPIALGVAGTLLALTAVGFAQPRVLVTWALLLIPFALAEGVRMFRAAYRAGGRARASALWALGSLVVLAVVFAGAAFAYLVLRLGLFDRPLDDRLGGPQAMATQSVAVGLWQVVSQSWPLGVGATVTFPAVLLAVAVLIGIVVATRTSGLRWVVVAYALVAVLFALAAGSDDVVAKLTTALWYKDRYRLSSAVPVLGVALGTLGILSAASWLRRPRAARVAAVAAAWLTALTAAVTLGAVTSTVASVFRLPATGADDEVVSAAQIAFMQQLDTVVPDDELLLGDPWDGGALTLLYGGVEPVFPHVNGQWDADRQMLAWRLQDIETDPAVCDALDRLRVRHVLFHPHEFGGGDPSGNHFIGVHTAVDAGLFTEVATDGDSTLYRIDQCGPLPR
ncbi:DUF6541 family protein [Microbacterium sp. GXF7504]